MENILLDRNGYCKLANFNNYLTLEFSAPELQTKDKIEQSVDYWRLGIIIYKMLTGNFPFLSAQSITNDRIPNLNHFYISFEVKEIIAQLLIKTSSQRLGSKLNKKNIKESAFFNDIDWVKLERRELQSPFVPFVVNIINFRL